MGAAIATIDITLVIPLLIWLALYLGLMWYCVPRIKLAVEEYQARLTREGIGSFALGGPAVMLEKPVPVERIPGFSDGCASDSIPDRVRISTASRCGCTSMPSRTVAWL